MGRINERESYNTMTIQWTMAYMRSCSDYLNTFSLDFMHVGDSGHKVSTSVGKSNRKKHVMDGLWSR